MRGEIDLREYLGRLTPAARDNLRLMLLEMERRMVCAVDDPCAFPRVYGEDGPRCFGSIPYTLIIDSLAVLGRR